MKKYRAGGRGKEIFFVNETCTMKRIISNSVDNVLFLTVLTVSLGLLLTYK